VPASAKYRPESTALDWSHQKRFAYATSRDSDQRFLLDSLLSF
jgi:hypothetical protein